MIPDFFLVKIMIYLKTTAIITALFFPLSLSNHQTSAEKFKGS